MSVQANSKSVPATTLPKTKSYAQLNVEGVAELHRAFKTLDQNKDGQLSVGEFQRMFKKFDIQVPDELVLDLIHRCSHTGSGELTETEFLEFVSTHLTNDGVVTAADDTLTAFHMFDTNHDGFISRAELKQGMEVMGEHLTEEDLDNMIASADTNHDGKIDYEEFTHLLS